MKITYFLDSVKVDVKRKITILAFKKFNFSKEKFLFIPFSGWKCMLQGSYQIHIHKNHNNVVNCDFVIPPLSDYWKSFIRSNFS